MPSTPRVLVVSSFVPPRIGGVESFCGWLSDALPAHVEFLSCTEPGSQSRWQVATRYPAGWPATLPTASNRRVVAEAVAWADSVLIQNTQHPLCLLAAREAHRRSRTARTIVHALPGASAPPLLRPAAHLYGALSRRLLELAPPLALSTTAAAWTERHTGRPCPVVPFPLAAGRMRPLLAWTPGDRFEMLFAGRLSPEKAPHDALAVAEIIGARARLTIAGAGPLDGPVRHRAERCGARVLGARSQDAVRELMAGTHAVLVPSRAETTGMSALEALTMGCPVVTSRVGDLPLHLGRHAKELSAPVGDTRGLAGAVASLMSSYPRWEAWARERARLLRHRHHPEAAIGLIMDSLLGAGTAGVTPA